MWYALIEIKDFVHSLPGEYFLTVEVSNVWIFFRGTHLVAAACRSVILICFEFGDFDCWDGSRDSSSF